MVPGTARQAKPGDQLGRRRQSVPVQSGTAFAPGYTCPCRRGCVERADGAAQAGSGGVQPHHRGAHGQPGGTDPATRRAYRRRRRQAAAPAAHAGLVPAVRLSRRRRRRAPREARRLRRVHPHRHPAARRRGGRKPAAAGTGLGQCGVRQPGIRTGRRFPVRPRLPVDGGGRLAARAGDPVARRGDDRRGRGAATGHAERPVHVRRRAIWM